MVGRPACYGVEMMSDKAAVLTAIIQYKIKNDGCTPTVRWLAKKCGISSSSTVQWFINELIADGKLRRGEGKRDLKVVGGRWEYGRQPKVDID